MNGAGILVKVERLCKEKNITIHKLETEAGIGNGIIARWKDVEMPSLKNLKKVADFLGVTVDELLKDGTD